MIKETTRITGDSLSYIELIFTTQPNLVIESGAQTVITTYSLQNSSLRDIISVLMNRKSGIIKRLMLTKLDKQ